jgi:hypothetical protein
MMRSATRSSSGRTLFLAASIRNSRCSSWSRLDQEQPLQFVEPLRMLR